MTLNSISYEHFGELSTGPVDNPVGKAEANTLLPRNSEYNIALDIMGAVF